MDAPAPTPTGEDQYVAGACNIGGADVTARRRAGWFGVVATAIVAIAVLALGAPPLGMLITAPFAYVAAIGHLQARARFCIGYAAAGRYGFGDRRGPSGAVEDAAARAADRDRARAVAGSAARWTILVTAALVALAWSLDQLS